MTMSLLCFMLRPWWPTAGGSSAQRRCHHQEVLTLVLVPHILISTGPSMGCLMRLSSLFEALVSLLGCSFLSAFNTDLGISWKKELHLRNCLHRLACGRVCGAFSLLVIGITGPSPAVGVPLLGQAVLGSVREQVEQAMESSTPAWFLLLLLLEFLP